MRIIHPFCPEHRCNRVLYYNEVYMMIHTYDSHLELLYRLVYEGSQRHGRGHREARQPRGQDLLQGSEEPERRR